MGEHNHTKKLQLMINNSKNSVLRFAPMKLCVTKLLQKNLSNMKICNNNKNKETFNHKISGPSNSIDQELLASTLIGLGLWRLRPYVSSALQDFTARVEGIIRQCCLDDGLK